VAEDPQSAVEGRRSSVLTIFRVRETKGPWLWLAADNSGLRGWVKVEDVVPFDQAVDYYTNEIRMHPRDPQSYVRRGNIWLAKRDYPKAITDYTEAVRLDPKNIYAYSSRGNAWRDSGQFDRAVADYSEAIKLDPERALSYVERGSARRSQKDYDRALADYNEAMRLAPRDPNVHKGLADVYLMKGDADRALAESGETIKLDPNDASAYVARSIVWSLLHDYANELSDIRAALRVDPDNIFALEREAWMLATLPDAKFRDGKRAVAAATRAYELTNGTDELAVSALAAAYAESGAFDDAVKWQTRALELLPQGKAKMRDEWTARLELYNQKKPFRGL
jgi:tetratricopeptide (TPR) repeat protein